MNFPQTLCLCLVAITWCGCEDADSGPASPNDVTADKVIQKTEESLDAAGKWAVDKKDKYVALLSEELGEYDAEIAELKAKGEKLKGEGREKWEQKMEELKEERASLQTRLEKVKASSGEAWKELREGTTKAWQEFQQGLQNAGERFSESS